MNKKAPSSPSLNLLRILMIFGITVVAILMLILVISKPSNISVVNATQEQVETTEEIEKIDTSTLDPLTVLMNNYNSNPELKEIALSLIGNELPKFSYIDRSGESHESTQERMVLYFGLTTCPACIEATPAYNSASERYSEIPFISIYLDKTTEDLIEFADANYNNPNKILGNDSLSIGAEEIKNVFKLRIAPTFIFVENSKIQYIHYGNVDNFALNNIMNILFEKK